MSPGTILLSDRTTVQLNFERVTTDVAEWQALLARAAKSSGVQEQVALLQQARALYRGDLLPGFYEDWVAQEQAALREKHIDMLHALALGLGKLGDHAAAAVVLEE